eukprot:gene19287-biopygen2488
MPDCFAARPLERGNVESLVAAACMHRCPSSAGAHMWCPRSTAESTFVLTQAFQVALAVLSCIKCVRATGERAAGKRTRHQKRECDTQGSHVITHRSTNWACRCLTSQIGRDGVLSPEYGRIQWHEHHHDVLRGAIAQLVRASVEERPFRIREVEGSNPSVSTLFRIACLP